MKKPLTLLLLLFSFFANADQHLLDSLLLQAKNPCPDSAKMNLYNDISRELSNSNSREAMDYAYSALKIAEHIRSPKGLSDCYTNIANIYSNTGELESALVYLKKAREAFPENRHVLARTTCSEGNVYSDMGKTGIALKCYLEALKEYEAENDNEGVRICYENLAITNEELNEFAKAKDFFNKSIAISKQKNNKEALSGSYINLGNMMERLGQFDSAKIFYLKGNELAREVGQKRWEANSLTGLGMVESGLKNYTAALEYYNRSLKIHRDEIDDQMGVSNAYHNIGEAYYQLKDYKNAIDMMKASEEIAVNLNALTIANNDESALSLIYSEIGDYKNAYDYHVKFLALKDSLMTIEGSKQIADMQAKYDTEKKENEIEVLTQKNQIQDLQLNKNKVIIGASLVGLILLIFLAIMIYKRYQLKQKANVQLELQNQQIQDQKEIIEVKNKDITDSIVYAKRIQEAILPKIQAIKSVFNDSFVFYKPKDIVSGDFYYFEKIDEENVLLSVVDCTGHGVPGAFMSIVGHNALSQAVNEQGLRKPGEVMDSMNKLLATTLNSDDSDKSVKDGMDMNLCSINMKNMKLQYAGAFNPLWLLRNDRIQEIKANKFPLGGGSDWDQKKFTNHELELQKGDILYLFSDGFADQFGGEKGKKFKYRNLQELLVGTNAKPLEEQCKMLENALMAWQGNLEQVDDILIIGVRI